MKIIAYYLPQYHCIPENDAWWGKGFTEWVNVKSAKPLYEDHYQPRLPQNNNFYDLLEPNTMKWQVKLAKDHGVYGFCFYHYWFDGKLLLEQPLDNFLKDKTIDMPFCMCWANESWTNGWAKASANVILEQKYGERKEWKEHFNYLLPFFKDSRYIYEDGKPLVVIYRPYLFERMSEMMDYWDELAKENGLPGLKFASQRFEEDKRQDASYKRMDYHIDYQPDVVNFRETKRDKDSMYKKLRHSIHDFILQKFNKDLSFHQKIAGPVKRDYDVEWNRVLQLQPKDGKEIPGAFVDWDNTPRHGRRGSSFFNSSPELFEKYMKKQIVHVRDDYKKDMMFMFAWNEWGEGGYLEPDEKYGTAYLDAIHSALKDTNELPF